MVSKIISAVVIPLYKPIKSLTTLELVSLKRTCTILYKHNFVLFGPKEISWNEYLEFFISFKIKPDIILFKSDFFKDINGYNQLLKSVEFYERFAKFKFILICQTDAYIFRDELNYWCIQGFDYIGAPWLKVRDLEDTGVNFLGVGNGGFSLRQINSHIRILKRVRRIMMLRKFWYISNLQGIFRYEAIIQLFKKSINIHKGIEINEILKAEYLNEDYYLAHILSNIFTDYSVPSCEQAIKFSFEAYPSLLFELNNKKLPFGCHAWQKNEPEFWDAYIN